MVETSIFFLLLKHDILLTFKELVFALHSIPSVICTKEEEREHMRPYFGDVERFNILATFLLHSLNKASVHEQFILFKSKKLKTEVYRCFVKCQ